MSEVNCVKNRAYLIIIVSPLIRIMFVPVAASDPSTRDSENDGSGENPEFVVIFSMPHLVSDGSEYLFLVSILKR